MPVLGLGGFFWRAADPAGLKLWYREHLGIGGGCGRDADGASSEWFWFPEPGPVVFEPFAAATDYLPPDRDFMLNLRVSDLDSLCEELNAAGIAIETRGEWDSAETGRFARIHDPEGNPIELWEPPVR